MTQVFISRRETFSASHRLASKGLSDAENERVFGKCFRPNGHGHNYVLEVTLKGEIDPQAEIVFNLSDLKHIIHHQVLERVDHKHLNLDVPEFKDLNPTTENLAVVIWHWLEPHIPKRLLYEVRVHETENNVVWYRGDRVD